MQCVCVCVCISAKSCPTLCDPMDHSPPGSPVPGILQARTLECSKGDGPAVEAVILPWAPVPSGKVSGFRPSDPGSL